MLYEFCYYIALTGTACMACAGMTWYFNRPMFDDITRRVGWRSLEIYHDVTTFISSLAEDDKGGKEELLDVSDNPILSYTSWNGETVTTACIPTMHDLLFYKRTIDGKTYCKRINKDDDISTLQISPITKPFIQVELKYGGDTCLDIHEYLDVFYVEGNHILDKQFLQWYLKYHFSLDLDDEYTINIIDKDVNIFNLTSDQSILLESDNYVVVTETDPADADNEEACEYGTTVGDDEWQCGCDPPLSYVLGRGDVLPDPKCQFCGYMNPEQAETEDADGESN